MKDLSELCLVFCCSKNSKLWGFIGFLKSVVKNKLWLMMTQVETLLMKSSTDSEYQKPHNS